MIYLFLILIIQTNILTVHNWIIDNLTHTIDETIVFGADDSDNDYDTDNVNEYYFDRSLTTEKYPFGSVRKPYIDPKKPNLHINKFQTVKKPKRQSVTESVVDELTIHVLTDATSEETYDYDKFQQEYVEELEKVKENEAKLNESEFVPEPKSECNSDKFYNKGPFTMMCLVSELCDGKTMEIKKQAKMAMRTLLKLWLIILLLFLVIGWAHFGYLSIFCPSKYYFPEEVLKEIKRELALNPPGTLTKRVIQKKNRNSETVIEQVYYQPTKTEIYLYNELWNNIYRK